jgi:tetratricopeptide (TPR) repeat protein
MNAKLRSLSTGLVLLLSVMVCRSQTAPSKQEALASHLQKAQTYLHQNRPDLAIPELQAALVIDPDNVEIRGNLGVLLFFQGKYDKALPQLQAAVAMKPDLWKIQSLMGIAERRTGDDHQGRIDLEAAFPHIEEQKLKTDVGLELIESYTSTDDFDKASDLIAELLRLKPTDPGLLYAAYRIHSDMMAEDLLSLSLAAPDSAQLHQAIAHELQRTHDLEGTIKNLRAALVLNPNLPGIHFELAEALHASDDQRLRAEALQQYKLAVLTNPSDPKAASRLGDIEVESGDLDAGEKDYERALKLQPDSADAKIGMANVLTEKGDPSAAAPLLEQVLAADPSNYLAHFRLSAVYRKLHRPDDVKRELDAYTKYKDMHEKLTSIYKTLDSPDKTPGK